MRYVLFLWLEIPRRRNNNYSVFVRKPSLRSKATPLTKADPTLTPLPGLLLHLDMQQDLEL